MIANRPAFGMLRRSVTLVVLCACLLASLGSPALAKLLPFEVQITAAQRAVRIEPREFYDRINVPDGTGVARHYGVFEYVPAAPAEPGKVLFTVSLRNLYDSRGGLTDDVTRALERDTVLVATYLETTQGAFGQIQPGGEDSLSVGRWIRYLPAFSALAMEAYRAGPYVEPITAPPYESSAPMPRPHVSPIAAVMQSYGLFLALAALVLLEATKRLLRVIRKCRPAARLYEPETV